MKKTIRLPVVSVIAGLFITLLLPVCAQGGKGYKGHPITLNPDSISGELALNGFGVVEVSLMSKETLHDASVWVVPELQPYVTVEPSSFEEIEAGEVCKINVIVSTPTNAVPGLHEGTIHVRDGNRTIAKPLPVSIIVLDEWFSPASDWRYRRFDLTGTSCNPNGSLYYAGEQLELLYSIPDTDIYVLTGDVDGDGAVEIITTSGDVLNIYSGNGQLKQSFALPRECQLSMLEDADDDGVLDIGLGSRGDGFSGYIYKSDGILLKELRGSHGGWYGDHSMIPLTISSGKVLVGYNAGYSKTPRGVASFDYTSEIEEWYYQIGPANGWYSIADMDASGTLDVTMNSHTVHNGASGNGTTDGDIYLVVVDEHGDNEVTQKYPSPSNGYAYHIFADMDGDGIQEIVGFEGHDATYYPGQAQIHIFDNQGSEIHTFTGPVNTGWDYAVGDLDGDGTLEVVASARNTGTTYILDNQLNLIDSANLDGNVKLACDLTGDGYKEIVLLDDNGYLRVVNLSLTVLSEVKCGNSKGNVIASDIDNDGIVELLVQTDQLYVLRFDNRSVAQELSADESALIEENDSEEPSNSSVVASVVNVDNPGEENPLAERVVSSVTDERNGNRSTDAQEYSGHYYRVFTDRLSWEEAEKQCRLMNGYLACISSDAENQFILELAHRNSFPRFTCAWVGATDVDKESQWKWLSGDDLSKDEHLLSHGGATENYLNLRLATGMWEDYPMEGELVGDQWFVCEWDTRPKQQVPYIKVADSEEDFSSEQGYKGWYYGYRDAGGIKLMDTFKDGKWIVGSNFWTMISASNTHPNSTTTSYGRYSEKQDTARRWKCDQSGDYKIIVELSDLDTHPLADGVVATVGSWLVINLGEDKAAAAMFETSLVEGEYVDLIISSNDNDFTDTTATHIEIYRIGDIVSNAAKADDLTESIQGVWELRFDDGSKRIKTIKNGRWEIEQRDPDSGDVVYKHGGSYTLDGSQYIEHVEYANENTAFLIGNSHVFEVSIEGNTLHQIGIGNPWTEDWVKVGSCLPTIDSSHVPDLLRVSNLDSTKAAPEG